MGRTKVCEVLYHIKHENKLVVKNRESSDQMKQTETKSYHANIYSKQEAQ